MVIIREEKHFYIRDEQRFYERREAVIRGEKRSGYKRREEKRLQVERREPVIRGEKRAHENESNINQH